MAFHCFKCGKDLGLKSGDRVGRRDSCPSCSADLHACRNCKFYDPQAYNECREPQADRVLEKDRSNFCDYFSFRDGAGKVAGGASAKDYVKSLDDLFKK